MFYQIIQYIKFLLKSTNQHGVHSPFVYKMVTECFYDKTTHDAYFPISNYKKELLKNQNKIQVTDLGAGSQVMKQHERTVSKMAKNAGTTIKRAKLLYRLITYVKPITILELGTSLGIASYSMSLGNSKANITTIEGCPNTSKFTKLNLKKDNINNVDVITGNFNDEIKELTKNPYTLIFFDDHPPHDNTFNYFESLLDTVNNNSVWVFDDIYWSKGMTEAWETIKKHPKVTVTIDTFYWGLVFFRKEQEKEHFTIRV